MIKAILIDDEADARFMLRNLLERHYKNQVEVIAEADGVDSAVEVIKQHNPDVLFLDIRMREGTGFDVLEKLKEKPFEVVFVTAFDSYAEKAFQFSALGYLMKPIKIKELHQVIDQLQQRLSILKESSDKRLKVLIENYGDEQKIQKLVISNVEGFKVISIDQILRLEGDRNYTHFILTGNKKITATKTLRDYENLLTDFGFFRVHQSTIVNLRHVIGYVRGDGGTVEMTDGSQVSVSRLRKAAFMERFI